MTAAEAGIGVRIRHLLLPALTLQADGRTKHHAAYTGEMIAIMERRLCAVCAGARESSGYIVKKKTCPAQSGTACHYPAVWFHQ